MKTIILRIDVEADPDYDVQVLGERLRDFLTALNLTRTDPKDPTFKAVDVGEFESDDVRLRLLTAVHDGAMGADNGTSVTRYTTTSTIINVEEWDAEEEEEVGDDA